MSQSAVKGGILAGEHVQPSRYPCRLSADLPNMLYRCVCGLLLVHLHSDMWRHEDMWTRGDMKHREKAFRACACR